MCGDGKKRKAKMEREQLSAFMILYYDQRKVVLKGLLGSYKIKHKMEII